MTLSDPDLETLTTLSDPDRETLTRSDPDLETLTLSDPDLEMLVRQPLQLQLSPEELEQNLKGHEFLREILGLLNTEIQVQYSVFGSP